MTEESKVQREAKKLPATVVKIIDMYKVVINRGSLDGIKHGQMFLVYAVAEEVFDPETGESLGRLELVRGRGTVSHVQEQLATLQSRKTSKPVRRTILRKDPWKLGTEEEVQTDTEEEILPFDTPKVGDKAQPI